MLACQAARSESCHPHIRRACSGPHGFAAIRAGPSNHAWLPSGYKFPYWLKRAVGAGRAAVRRWRAVLAHPNHQVLRHVSRATDPMAKDVHAGIRHQGRDASLRDDLPVTLDPGRRRASGLAIGSVALSCRSSAAHPLRPPHMARMASIAPDFRWACAAGEAGHALVMRRSSVRVRQAAPSCRRRGGGRPLTPPARRRRLLVSGAEGGSDVVEPGG